MLRRALFSARTVTPAWHRSLSTSADIFKSTDRFVTRHIGPSYADQVDMLKTLGVGSLEELVEQTVPQAIRLTQNVSLDAPLSESDALAKLKKIMSKNIVNRSFIGMGYYETVTPPVVLRNMLENPGWYTSYTPYQAEISQGRLQGLLNFQTMVADLTGMSLCNASLLDEATAASEAMTMAHAISNHARNKFFIDENCHPQNIAVMETKAKYLGIETVVGSVKNANLSDGQYCGAVVQYPDTFGEVYDLSDFSKYCHDNGALVIAVTDILASAILKPAGEMGADIAVGSAQRFGVPLGFGGPHAGFMATKEAYVRKMPGRIIGVSRDSRGRPALRLSVQTREQHIRRDKATSNICTAQALLANVAAAYGVYHGPEGVKAIATRVHNMTAVTAEILKKNGFLVRNSVYFDTIKVYVPGQANSIASRAESNGVNVRLIDSDHIGISFGESIIRSDVENLLKSFNIDPSALNSVTFASPISVSLRRTSPFMTHPVFNMHHSETQMLRYLHSLEVKDIALNYSMISLGSCTMKLNATAEMIPISWPEVNAIHPFAPSSQTQGYKELIESLHTDLARITGFAAISSQPNSGAAGEYAGLLCIRQYHASRGEGHRNICLIPVSAHGTNPASAAMAGLEVVVVKSDKNGNVDLEDFKQKAEKHRNNLAAVMITYPSTYGVFEEGVTQLIDITHKAGGQVYMDGANMNAQVCLTSPGHIGADVCHLNLHKTFCIPHGGGGPGVGTIGVAPHLAPFLPGHVVTSCSGEGRNTVAKKTGEISAAPHGSASILPISWMYIKMLGEPGLKEATSVAILNANYMAKRLDGAYGILFRGRNDKCAHEFIMDLRPFKEHGITEEDVAKRLQDYGYHSPTMSWPVPGTLMVEPTESESREELDKFCDAMLSIRAEIEDVVQGRIAAADSPLKHAPHTMDMVYAEPWTRKYSRKVAGFPAPWTNPESKYWPTVGRVDNIYGDRNLVCSCPPLSTYDLHDECHVVSQSLIPNNERTFFVYSLPQPAPQQQWYIAFVETAGKRKMGSGISAGRGPHQYKENGGASVPSNDHGAQQPPNNTGDAPKRRTSLIPNTPHDVKVHSMISPSFTVDPSLAAQVPLAHATDEELLAEVARRKLNIRHNITDKVVKETYDIGEQIGKGASGIVLKVVNRHTHEQFAMKVVEKNDSMNDLDSMMTEIEIMKRVRHRHIVCMYELYESPVCLWIVLEMVTGGSLHSFLMSAGDEYTEMMAARHIKQMLQGVHYLHSLGIIHRDLKVENILLQKVGDQLEVKIADFGLSAICAIGVGGYDAEHSVKRKKYNLCTELWGTKEYFAPELIDRAYGPQVDMWSLGCIAYEMLAGEPAFSLKKCRKEHILFDKIRRGDYSLQFGVWNEISVIGKDFVKSLLCVKPTRRLCATEALNHPWILESAQPDEDRPSPAGAPLTKQQSLRNVADNYRKNFAEDRKLKKGGSRFNLIDALPRDPIEEKSESKSTVASGSGVNGQC